MKKFLIGCAAATMMLSPAIAEAGGRHGHGNGWIGPVIFGTVLGVIIGNSNNGHSRHKHHRRHRHGHGAPASYWVEVCGPVTYARRDHHNNYRQVFRNECRMVKKARW